MDKETALRELNKLCNGVGNFVPIQDGEFTSIEFANSRGCSHRTATRILGDFEGIGIVTRRYAASPTGGAKTVWRFTDEYLAKLKETAAQDPLGSIPPYWKIGESQETPPGGLQREPSQKIPVRYPTHSE